MYYIIKYESYFIIVDEEDHCYGYYQTLHESKRSIRRLLTLNYGLEF
jgi:hypothetical protein